MGQPRAIFQDCHSDTVTRLRFNPAGTLLCSGSEDGLVCILDLSQSTEEDALLSIVPVNHCISKVGFFGTNRVFVCTSTEQFSLWDVENSVCLQSYGDVRERFSGEGRTIDYMIDCVYQPNTDELLLFAGSHAGDMVLFQPQPNDLLHRASFDKGHTDVVRAIQYLPEDDLILSAGEDGRVCVWKPSNPTQTVEEEADYLTGSNLAKDSVRQRFRYVLNPYYMRTAPQ